MRALIFSLIAIALAETDFLQHVNYGSMGHTHLEEPQRSERSIRDQEESYDEEISAEKQLINRLMNRYHRAGRGGRPVLNSSTAVNVSFGLGLIQMDLNEKEKILTMSMWTKYIWVDEYMQWDPNQYDGVSEIRVEPEEIWIPDIQLYNTADVDVPARAALAVIRFDGTVSWYPHCIFRSSCSIDVSDFPFDEQACHMAFGSWTHTAREVDLHMSFPEGIDLSTFHDVNMESSAWDIKTLVATRQLAPPNDAKAYSVLTFQLHLQRKLVFSSYILTLPCIFLAFLTLVTFWLPPERPDRTALGMSTFSSFMVLLLILVESAPPTANTVPRLGVYYCFIMVIIMLSIILSSMVVNIARGPANKSSPVPRALAFITLTCLSRILFLPSATKAGKMITYAKPPKPARKPETGRTHKRVAGCCPCVGKSRDIERANGQPVVNGTTTQRTRLLSNSDVTDSSRQTNRFTSYERSPPQNAFETLLGDIEVCLKRIEECMGQDRNTKTEQNRIMWQWKCVAAVLDRFFFVTYLFLNIMSLIIFFPRPKNLF